MYGNGLENSVRLFTLPFYSSWFRILNAIRVVAEKFGNLFLSYRPLHIYARNVVVPKVMAVVDFKECYNATL